MPQWEPARSNRELLIVSHPYPSYAPGCISVPRVKLIELINRAVDYKRHQLITSGHPCPDLLRNFEPAREPKLVDGWAEICLIGIWQTREQWNVWWEPDTDRLRLERQS